MWARAGDEWVDTQLLFSPRANAAKPISIARTEFRAPGCSFTHLLTRTLALGRRYVIERENVDSLNIRRQKACFVHYYPISSRFRSWYKATGILLDRRIISNTSLTNTPRFSWQQWQPAWRRIVSMEETRLLRAGTLLRKKHILFATDWSFDEMRGTVRNSASTRKVWGKW